MSTLIILQQRANDAARQKVLGAVRRAEAGEVVTVLNLARIGVGLTILPPEIGRLTALIRLNLENNLLNKLPREMLHLMAMECLQLCGNLIWLPVEILGESEETWTPKDTREFVNPGRIPAKPQVILEHYFAGPTWPGAL